MKLISKKPGNPGKAVCESTRISTYVTADIAKILSENAESLGISVSEYVKRLLFIALAQE